MKSLLTALVLMAMASAPVLAGPNAGGVIVVHNTGRGVDDRPASPDARAHLSGIRQRDPDGPEPGAASENLIWKVYAAFPPSQQPAAEDVRLGHLLSERRRRWHHHRTQ